MTAAVDIGPIRPSDVTGLARLHRAAFPGFFLSSLGEPFLIQFYRGFIDDPSAVTVVLRDEANRPVGSVVGTGEPEGFFGRLLRRQWFGFGVASVKAVVARPSAAVRLLRAARYRGDAPPGMSGALLSSICLDPGLQGSGAGSRLLARWEQAAAAAGAPSAFLTTDAVNNDGVNSFYVRNGWRLQDSYGTREGRSLNRYTKGLGPL